ncbi:MAG: hypothetical protein ACTHMB_15295 [Candidatus Binatia bacterium]
MGFAVVFIAIIASVSGAEAIDIYFAEVKNGGAFVRGDKAAAYSTITWEGQNTAAANRYGGFRFVGTVPQSCIGSLSDGTSTIQVVAVDCTPDILPTAIVTGELQIGAVTGG